MGAAEELEAWHLGMDKRRHWGQGEYHERTVVRGPAVQWQRCWGWRDEDLGEIADCEAAESDRTVRYVQAGRPPR